MANEDRQAGRQTDGVINLSAQQLLFFFCPPAADGVHANKKKIDKAAVGCPELDLSQNSRWETIWAP